MVTQETKTTKPANQEVKFPDSDASTAATHNKFTVTPLSAEDYQQGLALQEKTALPQIQEYQAQMLKKMGIEPLSPNQGDASKFGSRQDYQYALAGANGNAIVNAMMHRDRIGEVSVPLSWRPGTSLKITSFFTDDNPTQSSDIRSKQLEFGKYKTDLINKYPIVKAVLDIVTSEPSPVTVSESQQLTCIKRYLERQPNISEWQKQANQKMAKVLGITKSDIDQSIELTLGVVQKGHSSRGDANLRNAAERSRNRMLGQAVSESFQAGESKGPASQLMKNLDTVIGAIAKSEGSERSPAEIINEVKSNPEIRQMVLDTLVAGNASNVLDGVRYISNYHQAVSQMKDLANFPESDSVFSQQPAKNAKEAVNALLADDSLDASFKEVVTQAQQIVKIIEDTPEMRARISSLKKIEGEPKTQAAADLSAAKLPLSK